MTEPNAIELTEDRIPFAGIEETIGELVDLYGGEITAERERERVFLLPLRRGMATSGSVECTLSWAPDDERDATVRLRSDRTVDAPKAQRVMLLLAGVIGSVLFLLWPFFPDQKQYGTLAWLGAVVAIAVYLMTLKRTSGGLAADFLSKLAARQRAGAE